MKDLRKGVSLITVLLLMLVATIAGTATYKWLTSEGRSSASRLLMNQARAAAVAGVDAARSWMSSHGSETGAIVQQFFDNPSYYSFNPLLGTGITKLTSPVSPLRLTCNSNLNARTKGLSTTAGS